MLNILRSLASWARVTVVPAKTPAEEVIALAKSEGFELTKDEAEAYMAELADVELDGREMKNVAGGTCYMADEPCKKYSNS